MNLGLGIILFDCLVLHIFVHMKRNKLHYCLLLLCFSFGCETNDEPLLPPASPPAEPAIDYRSAFCGDFACYVKRWSYWSGSYHYSDSINYFGYVEILDGTDSLLMIRYRPGIPRYPCENGSYQGSYIKPTLQPDGRLRYAMNACWPANERFEGQFWGLDSLSILVGTDQNGDLIQGVRAQ